MDNKPLDETWAKELLAASKRGSEEREREFLLLVDRAMGRVSLMVAKALMATFSDEPDHGTQERVCSVLASGDHRIVAEAIVAELPRLLTQGPEWAESLLGEEVKFRPAQIADVIRRASTEPKRAALELLSLQEFAEFYENSQDVMRRVGA
jgi:hypothetical protein